METKTLIHLRELMSARQIDALIIPGTDPHGSEYIAEHWQERRFVSGFTGSAGTLAITLDQAGLWTDSRYYLQGEEQLQGSGITLMKDGMPETPSIAEWLKSTLGKAKVVAVNPAMFNINGLRQLEAKLLVNDITINTNYDLVNEIWSNRPELPSNPIICLDTVITGKSCSEKLTDLREALNHNGCNSILLTALDDIAWLFNIRGNDIMYNPVVISYAIITDTKAILYIDSRKIDEQATQHLSEAMVEVRPYDQVFDDLKMVSGSISIDFNKVNVALYKSLPADCLVVDMVSPIVLMKSIKNGTELKGIRKAMVKDGVALTRFLHWLMNEVPKGEVTELSAMSKLYDCRAEQEEFFSESFGTIAGYGAHGAIVHYGATAESNSPLKAEGLFLVDSGGQYYHGTTDITRTVALGAVTRQEKQDYTNVLKGHIALANAVFPMGTRGCQLDILARQFLWNNGLQYGHGTGHGIGHFLCVHEGPQSIRMDENPTKLQPGMVLSNEPGLYRSGQYGIRIENLISVKTNCETEFGDFLSFDTLTLFPYDRNAIALELLTNAEIEWIDRYHEEVYDLLKPYLSKEEKQWLDIQTQPLL